MRNSWADSVENVATDNGGPSGASGASASTRRSSYVPPHLRNRPMTAEPLAPSHGGPPSGNDRSGFNGPTSGPRWGGSRPDYGRQGGYGGGGRGGGWGGRGGGWGREREVNPFGNDADVDLEQSFDQENTGINFDAYEDIPVETSGENVPPPVNTFAEIDLGEAVNLNIRRCKYVKPTPVQRYAIPISLAGRDLMACAQTGSGKTAAFCFPIISGIMRGNFPCIANGHIAEDTLTFCSCYVVDIETRFNRPRRVHDYPNYIQPSGMSTIFPQFGKPISALENYHLAPMKKLQAHRYVLLNCSIVTPFVEEFRQQIRRSS